MNTPPLQNVASAPAHAGPPESARPRRARAPASPACQAAANGPS